LSAAKHPRSRHARTLRRLRAAGVLAWCVAWPALARAQAVTQRGFVEADLFGFPQAAPNDSTRAIGDLLAREELFAAPAPWLRLAAGVDLRANSHDQVEDSWAFDAGDRTIRRPRLSLRRASATITRGRLTVDAGKQFVRWGRTDVVTPTDRFAPRDFLDVFDNEFLAVSGARATVDTGVGALEAAATRFTPARLPLVDQRWNPFPSAAALPRSIPDRAQLGVRFNHTGGGLDWAASYFDGNNYLPNLDAAGISFPPMRMIGGDAAVPTRWVTLKGEAAYFASSSLAADEYAIYVVQLERQAGEWVFVGGYAGEVITSRRSPLPEAFAPDRGTTRSIVGRASYTIDVNRSFAVEAAVRTGGDGEYAKLEYSHAYGQHWRATASAVAIAGHAGDFIGQYHRNSHAAASLRYSF